MRLSFYIYSITKHPSSFQQDIIRIQISPANHTMLLTVIQYAEIPQSLNVFNTSVVIICEKLQVPFKTTMRVCKNADTKTSQPHILLELLP